MGTPDLNRERQILVSTAGLQLRMSDKMSEEMSDRMSWWGSHEERYFLTHVGIFVQDIFTWNPSDPCVGGFDL